MFPTVLRNIFNLPMKLVTGYPRRRRHQSRHGARRSRRPLRLVVDSLLSHSKALLDGKKINIVLQIGAARSTRTLPNVPLIMDLPSDPQDKAALKLIVSRQSIARPFAAPPGVPRGAGALLRAAFDATMKDPNFVAEASSSSSKCGR